MEQQYIYIVGQPDMHSDIAQLAHEQGYGFGVLLDENLTLKNPERYDRIERVRYDDIDNEIERLSGLDLSIAGLICHYENYVVAKAKLGTRFEVPSLSLDSARLCTDKSLMRRAFLDYDRSISPEFALADSLEEVLNFARSHGYPLILKPTNLVKSLLVLQCSDENELIRNYTEATLTIKQLYEKYRIYDREPQLIIEEYVTGKQCSIAAFVDDKGVPHFCDSIVELTNAQNIQVDDNYLYRRVLPATIPKELSEELFRVAEAGVKALKLRSVPAHIELMYGESGVKIIEIGARIGGYRPRMYHYAYGLDLTAQEFNLAIGNTPQLKGTFRANCAVYELFPETTGEFAGLSGPLQAADCAYYRITANPGDKVGPAKNGYKATAIIIITDTDESSFKEKCNQAEQTVVRISL